MFSIIEIARSNPELIIFLDKLEDLKNHRNELHYVGSRTCISSIAAKDVETQTEMHPIPSNIDKNYHWNIWDLRRKAINLAYMMKCETNSTQTKISYGNFNASTQTFSSKTGETQTRCNGSTDMPKPTTLHSYIRDIDFGGVSGEIQCLNLPDASVGISAVKLRQDFDEMSIVNSPDTLEERPTVNLLDPVEEIQAVNSTALEKCTCLRL